MRALPLLLAMLAGDALAQFCPSFTASSPNNTGDCAIEAVRGTNPTVAEWQAIFDTVSKGPSFWGSNGPAVGAITAGCARPTPAMTQPPRFPCELIKAISMQESSWKQFCAPTTPDDQRGRPDQTIISFDCGYGIGQVTSGMRRFDATPNYDRARVASDPLYNLATGMQILAEKWRVTACVGDRQPRLVEHWYTAAWAYNGLSTTNNPNNPNFSTTRGICRPGACPSRSAPYQERVWGWMEFPPTPGHWRVLRPAYPRLSDLGTASRPPALPDPSCASPTSCTATRAMNVSECLGDGGAPDAGRPDAGPPPMPDAGPPPRPDAGGEVDAGVPVTLPAAPTTFAAPGCGCGAVDGLALGACFALVTARRRRGRNR